jgi:DNA invertase Pin-like site-specific DNA recombinase
MFERDGTMYFASMGSASKSDSNNENAFISELVKAIAHYRPRHVWGVAFTRFCRNAEFAGDLLKVMSENIEVLHCESLIDLSTPEGKMMFQFLAMIAAAERDYIVRRHTAGRMNQWRNNQWIPISYPAGYKLDKDRRIILDEESIVKVRAIHHRSRESISSFVILALVVQIDISTPQ